MVELRYIGNSNRRRTWTGPVTGSRYPFGPGETRYVDKRDAQVWLHPPRGEGRAFEKWQL
jgi:hypothetical protein